jgi:Bacterial transcriptional regulator
MLVLSKKSEIKFFEDGADIFHSVGVPSFRFQWKRPRAVRW